MQNAAEEQRLVSTTAHHVILVPEPPKLPNETWLLPRDCDDDFLTTDLVSLAIAMHRLFLGGWHGPLLGQFMLFGIDLAALAWFAGKTFFFILFFILLRSAIPRPRYDQLMGFGWKVLLPITILNLVVTGYFVLEAANG
jgi:NADH-quinone oxidoreductase subunit H